MRLRRAGRLSDRECLLRQAALFDRQTVNADPRDGKAQTYALIPAGKLLAFGVAHGTGVGPISPDDGRWATDPRGYVRQEYAAWTASQQTAPLPLFALKSGAPHSPRRPR
ncbi:hypothetical protein [Streptomyces sp. NPDC048350]|uniref:hypothetical protein n=1 Tax=Streptomyces sp. NPDC048350 TaxID=3365538 RepID=UPI003715CBA0